MLISDTERLPWEETGAAGLTRKILSENADAGPQTILLRSESRPKTAITDRRPQYHPVDEEFLCLAGRFTLEGSYWLTPLTYVYYPPRLVHGFGVDVPDGYTIYLRNNGPVTTERVDTPPLNRPYFLDHPEDSDGCVVADCADLVSEAARSETLTAIILRDDAHRREGARLICLAAGQSLEFPFATAADSAELLVVDGSIQLDSNTVLPRHGHAVAKGPSSSRATALEAATVMLNYRGEGVATALARQVSLSLDCPNGFG